MNVLPLLAFVGGVALAIQASMNAQLGILLKNPLFATAVAFGSSLIFTLIILGVMTKESPSMTTVKSVPSYLWFSGGLLSTFAIASFYWLIPRMGIGPMLTYSITGQLLFAMLIGHFGWFQATHVPISLSKLIGVMLLIAGVVLINQR